MSSISSTGFNVGGLISGLDTNDIITQLMDIERRPIVALESKKTETTSQLSAWRELNTRIQALKIYSDKLTKESTFQVRTATTSHEDILTVSASSGTNTSSFTITVKSLATSHQITSQSYTSSDVEIGTGSFEISIGSTTYDEIEITEDNNTLAGLADSINDNDYGVTASVIKAADEDYRLILTGENSGSDKGISIDSNLSGGTSPTFSTIQEAEDAHIVLGTGASALDVYRSSNVINDAVDGVTISLKSADENTQVTIALSNDNSSTETQIGNYITQFNNLITYFEDQFAYDADTGETGTLFSNTNLLKVKYDLYSAATDPIKGDSSYHSINEIGIGVDETGRLFVEDDALLINSLEDDMEGVMSFFSDEDSGLAVRLDNYLENITDTQTGILYTIEDYFNSEIESLTDSIEVKEEYMSRLEVQYYKKFAKMEAALAQLQTQSNYIDYQITALLSNQSGSSSTSS
ncbi:MAG: flagellar filament capping protein FliD [Candidatus Eremiobacteraeota bacterium]|nr:flagellar filament capping protein FliD [Candidatus Eremiobacteraeota bacterium]